MAGDSAVCTDMAPASHTLIDEHFQQVFNHVMPDVVAVCPAWCIRCAVYGVIIRSKQTTTDW